jgi:group I intron endonuclease
MSNKSIGIYKITNIVTNKLYVGSSIDIKRRKYEHIRLLKNNKHNNIHLQNAYNKYGILNLKWEIL